MFKADYRPVHISTIVAGDVVMHDGFARTVTNKNLGMDALFGVTLFGDSYKAGHLPVMKAFDFHVKPARG